MKVFSGILVFFILIQLPTFASETLSSKFYPTLQKNLQQAITEFDRIDDARKVKLKEIADFIVLKEKENEQVQLTFICTSNTRRSQMSQIWAKTAAVYYEISNVETYSGGTKSKALNPRTASALERAGFKVEKTTNSSNPIYHIRYNQNDKAITAFSKVFNNAPNPKEHFCAVMTCSAADKACPIVSGSEKRVAIPYEDPKVADNTPGEVAKYDERCQQICREILYIFSQVKKAT
jgi:arsenate reductase